MKYLATRAVFAYWDALRQDRSAPERAEIDPAAISHVLADTFLIEVNARTGHPIRLAGTRLDALFRRELKGAAFTGLWRDADEGAELVEIVTAETSGIVAGLAGHSGMEEDVRLELLLLPLGHRGSMRTRILGVLSPGVTPHWLGIRAIDALSQRSLRVISADRRVEWPFGLPPAPSGATGERRGPFVVYEGGKDA